MFQAIKQKVVKQNKAVGISVRIAQDGSTTYSYCLLEQEKGLVNIKSQGSNIPNLDKIKSIIPQDCPVVLQIDGKGFLHKHLEGSKIENNKIVSSIIPNAKDEDFYLQNSQEYISIIRRNNLDEILNSIEKEIGIPVAVSFGPFALSIVLPLINSEIVNLDYYNLATKDNKIVSFSINENTNSSIINIGEQALQSNEILSYAVALQFLIGLDINCKNISKVEQQAGDWNEKLFFKKAGWAIMLFFLALLLINFILYSFYDNKNKELQQQRYGSGNQFSLQENLQKQVTQKEEFLQKAGWLSPSKMSYFADRLASQIPSSIKLTELKINPVEEIIENEIKKQIFKNRTVIIKGTCSNPSALNSWIKIIDDYEWIESAKLNNYLYDNREHQANFILDIKIKE